MLMMLSFGHAFCPKYDDDDADDDRLLAASNLKPLGDINGAGLWQLPSRVKPLGDQWCWLAAAAFPGALLCHVGRLGFS